MIIGAIYLLSSMLMGGDGHFSVLQMLEAMSPIVAEQVVDPVRAEAAEDVLERTRLEISGTLREMAQYRLQLVSGGLDRASTEAELEAPLARIRELRERMERGFIARQLELREYITAEEWTAIYAELDAMRK